MARTSKPQRATIARVMHQAKHGELSANGRKVRNPKQAIAIALREAGASDQETPKADRAALARTKRRERGDGPTRAELYAEATRRGVAGRSRMDKPALARALGR